MSTAQRFNQISAQFDPATPLGDTPADSAHAEPRYAEQITEIAGRLRRRYPTEQISQIDLEGRVRGFHRQFDTVRIRTFVAVFVERLVRGSIELPRGGASAADVAPRQG